MKKFLIVLLSIVLFAFPAMAATTVTAADPVIYTDGNGNRNVILEFTLEADGSGGAVSNHRINDQSLLGLQLIEVETIYGTSTASVTITNGRGTTVWSLAALDATANKIYVGHKTWGIFPMKGPSWWNLSTGSIDASDTVKLYLKFSSR
jgi:hypothetical protein